MTHKIFHFPSFVALLVVVVLTACSTDCEVVRTGNCVPLTLDVAIEGASLADATTRAERYSTHDLWSIWAFEADDRLGFFSKTGGGADGTESMVNVELTAESVANNGGGKFRAGNGTDIGTDNLTANDVLFYYPYNGGITSTPGMELRVVDDKVEEDKEPDGIKRCIDFLIGNGVDEDLLKENTLSGVIKHAFAELIITRGKGFENWESLSPEQQKITVVMKDPVTHVRINCTTSPWSCKAELKCDEDYKSNCDGNDARRWVAWKGKDYNKTGQTEGTPAWYVIVPTLKGHPLIVEYIEIRDNEGKIQRVTVLRLNDENEADKQPEHKERDGNYVWAGWRYPMEIVMSELVPTVNPYPILPWEQTNNDITKERARGIANATEFGAWLSTYNAYIESSRNSSYKEDLETYGDLEVEGEKEVWHFYISADIDFKSQGNTTIPTLEDILDGQSETLNGYAFSNHTLTNITRTFVGELKGNGALRNIDFKSPTVTVPAGTQKAGIIANAIDGGTVSNCNINNGGLIGNTDTQVGIVAGSITGGTVENCTLSGLIIGEKSDKTDGYMFGSKSGNLTLTNNNSTNVTFSDINQTDDEP